MQRITLWIACVLAISYLVESSNVRLINGARSCSGRVEIHHVGQWGTVCDDGWDIKDAEVVCRELGCGRPVAAFLAARFGPGSGPVWLSNLDCSGSESSITQCANYRPEQQYCDHNKDAGVECSESPNIRLANGDHPCSGRVEIYHAGQWGTVCNDGWDRNDGAVVCRELGCSRTAIVSSTARFGPGSGPIWLSNIDCSGSESSITQCANYQLGQRYCDHSEDAAVECLALGFVFILAGVLVLLLIAVPVIICCMKKKKSHQQVDTQVTESARGEQDG